MLKLNKKILQNNVNVYTKFPEDLYTLRKMILDEMLENGSECSLNHIDVSNIKNLSGIFSDSYTKFFNGDISDWDVSNVKDMSYMFGGSYFTGENSNLNNWNVSNVKIMEGMFQESKFNSDISSWNVSNVKYMNWMFCGSQFNQDISCWKIKKDTDIFNIFATCDISENNKPKCLK